MMSNLQSKATDRIKSNVVDSIQRTWELAVSDIASKHHLKPKFEIESDEIVTFGFGSFAIVRTAPRKTYFLITSHNYDSGEPLPVRYPFTHDSVIAPVEHLLPIVLGEFMENLAKLRLLGIIED